MEEIKIIELPEKPSISATNYLIAEDEDGTKRVLAKHLRSLLVSSLYFNNVEELKNSKSTSLKDGDIVHTLGYHEPGDGGGATYKITYNPARVEDGGLVHYLTYSDTLRAEMILEDSVNVHQFGAVGDGKTDDSKAIQAAINNATYKIIEFNNNKTYLIKKTIKINKDNVIINGNGAILSPSYCDGICIEPIDNINGMVSNITVNKMNIDCNNAMNAGIIVYKSSKIDIMGCKLYNISSRGIIIKNSEFVSISGCELIGKNEGSLIAVNGDYGSDLIDHNRFVNIFDCNFSNFFRAIHITPTNIMGDINTAVNINKCNYHSVVETAYCICIESDIDMVSVNANTVTHADTFLYFGGVKLGAVTCRDISCIYTKYVFDIETVNGVLYLDGSLKVDFGAIIFARMSGKLHSNISWDLLEQGASFPIYPDVITPTGEIYDTNHPYNYEEGKGYYMDYSTLVITEARNLHVDWNQSGLDLRGISNGIKGQLIYIKSSTNMSLHNYTCELSDEIIKLGKYKGIILRFNGTKWIQIQYKDSTVLQTVRNEIESGIASTMIDYDTIKFVPNELADLIN